ncbi:hypothetical protein OG389_35225 [Streptomyces sp. NBC_00435]|uniref:hypothetical protein n=1 Tax=Streptomyces sp. NBC_00435 TaxID=2903649 RepID=UPI002E231994
MFSRVRQPVIAAIAVTSLCAVGAYAAAADGPGASSVADPAAPAKPSASIPVAPSASASASASASGSASASAKASPSVPAKPSPSSSVPTTAVESAYPNSAEILANDGIKLVRGDGGITLAECGISTSQIRVYTYEDRAAKRKPIYCFNTGSQNGRITFELDRVFAFDTGEHPVSAVLTSGTATTTVDVDKYSYAKVTKNPLDATGRVVVALRVTG